MRTFSTVIGAVIAFLSLVYVISVTNVPLSLFISKSGLVLVIIGTFSAMLLSFSIIEIKRVFNIVTQIFFKNEKHMSEVALDLIKFCQESRISGFNIEKGKQIHPFISDCIVMINDGYSSEEIRSLLEIRIQTYANKEQNDIGIIKSLVKYPPAFGMLGTVIGLIAMMAGMNSENGMKDIGINMAVALTTTLYGLLISNFMFKPIADNLAGRSERNFTLRNMVMECMIMAKEKKSVIIIQDVANSFLTAQDTISIYEEGQSNAA